MMYTELSVVHFHGLLKQHCKRVYIYMGNHCFVVLPGHLRVYKFLARAFNYEFDNGMFMKSA